MANFIQFTEQLDHASWAPSDTVVTANTHAAPAFADPSASMADTVADNNAAAQGYLMGTDYELLVTDSSDYVGSVFIRKDAITTRWPEVAMRFGGGTTIAVVVSINTSTGAIAAGSPAPAAQGVVDVDANWWRLWMRQPNNGTNTVVRMYVFPDHLDALGGSTTSSGTGSVVLWGFNVTNTSTVQTYEPHPPAAGMPAGVLALTGRSMGLNSAILMPDEP